MRVIQPQRTASLAALTVLLLTSSARASEADVARTTCETAIAAEQAGGRRTDEECMVFNSFLMKRGWHDPADNVQRLRQRIAESGLQGQPIETFFDYIDFDEGRDPVSTKLWDSAY